jgi:hypothetical protein
MEKNLWHKRLSDFESFDKITFEVIPRYKTSGMSGDEWRQHVEVKFWFKGEEVHSSGYRDMQAALTMVGAEWIKAQEPIPERVIEIERAGACDQPSCPNASEGRLRLKEEFERGHKLHPDESKYHVAYRQFCKRHIRRGDCSREDSDDNYEPMDAASAADSTNVESSPSVMAVPIIVESEADIDKALRDLKKRL